MGRFCRKLHACRVAVVLAAAHLLLALGALPTPALLARIGLAAVSHEPPRYPCEGGGCGCTSAPECWAHCCCHTPAERLAWARRNGVTPPPHVLAVADRTEHQGPGPVPVLSPLECKRQAGLVWPGTTLTAGQSGPGLLPPPSAPLGARPELPSPHSAAIPVPTPPPRG